MTKKPQSDASSSKPLSEASSDNFLEDFDEYIQGIEQATSVHLLDTRTQNETEQLFSDAIRVVDKATEIMGDIGDAVTWYRSEPLSEFAGKTAQALVDEHRADEVIQYLSAIRSET